MHLKSGKTQQGFKKRAPEPRSRRKEAVCAIRIEHFELFEKPMWYERQSGPHIRFKGAIKHFRASQGNDSPHEVWENSIREDNERGRCSSGHNSENVTLPLRTYSRCNVSSDCNAIWMKQTLGLSAYSDSVAVRLRIDFIQSISPRR